MTPPNPLTVLAERVERLAGPCRETDALIAAALRIVPDFDPTMYIVPLIYEAHEDGSVKVYAGKVSDGPGHYVARRKAALFTASLDAAMTLRLDWMSVEMMESAPEPQFTRCRVWDWRRSPTMSDPGNEWKAEGNRPLPLNICAALLRARAASESHHETT